MVNTSQTKLVVIEEETAEKFQEAFNSKLSELQDCDPTYEFNHNKGFCAYIIYSEKNQFMGTVKPVNVTICDHCLRCSEPPRPHVKWRTCDIYGHVTKKDTKCSEFISKRVGDTDVN